MHPDPPRMGSVGVPPILNLIVTAAATVALLSLLAATQISGTAEAQATGICDRTPAVRDEILESLAPGTQCEDVTETDLNGITTSLSIPDPSLDSLRPDDFKGLTAIRVLSIFDTALENLPAGIFSDLQSVTSLSLVRNRLTTVEARAFEGLSAMTTLNLSDNPRLESISSEAFEGLGALRNLNLSETRISVLPSGVFDGSASLTTLRLSNTLLVTLPQGVFDPLTALSQLDLHTNGELTSLPTRTFVNNPSLGRLRLDTNPKLSSLPDEMFSSGHTLVDVNLNGTAIETLPANFIAALGSIGALDLPSTLTAWPTGFDLPDTLYRLKIRGNETFHTLPDDVLSTPLPQALTGLRFHDIQLSDGTLDAIGAHQPVNINSSTDPPPLVPWSDFWFENTGITGADLTELINDWCYNVASCQNWNGPRHLGLQNEDLSDWLDPDGDAATLTEHRAAVQRLNLSGTLTLWNTQMSAGQVTELLTHMPKNLRYLRLLGLELDGLDIGSSTFTFSQFTELQELMIAESEIGDATAKKIIEDLPPLQNLWLYSNNIQTVPAFPSYPNLIVLHLYRNPLETVTVGAFDSLPALLTLGLSYGELVSIPAGMLDNNTRLRFLYLNNNGLDTLPPGIFDNNADLTRLYLNDNKLTELSADLLHKVTDEPVGNKLLVLDLSNNLLTALPAGFFDGREYLTTLDLSNNLLTELPTDFLDGREYLTTLDLSNNLLTSLPDGIFRDNPRLESLYLHDNELGLVPAQFANLKRLQTFTLEDKKEEVEDETPAPSGLGTILRIEPGIRAVTLGASDTVRLGVNIYGRQDLLDNSLAGSDEDGDRLRFAWTGDAGGGSFMAISGNSGTDSREVLYTASERPGTYILTANLPFDSGCLTVREGEEQLEALARCSAQFEVTVRRPSQVESVAVTPVNPPGPISETLTDSEGTAYAVFNPEDGGSFQGEGVLISAGAGAVANGEFIGISMAETGDASNAGSTDQRYTLGGSSYVIKVVDSSSEPVTNYVLQEPATVCLPLPHELRGNITGIAIAAIAPNNGLTVLASSVKITPNGVIVCGGISGLPASVAVGTLGAPPPLPVIEPEETEQALPETGGTAPSNAGTLWALILGSAIVVSGYAVLRVARRRNNQMR